MNLQTRFAELREKQAQSAPFPLSTFLTIYTKATHDCYINYMEGAKALYNWLAEEKELDYELVKYPAILDTSFKVPRLLRGYETSEVAVIISGESYGFKYQRASRAIYFTLQGMY